MEADKVAARLPGVFPFNFCVPSSSPSTVFPPMPVFNTGPLQQMYASLLQQQLLQFAQQGVGSLGGDLSPSVSDRASSREDSPTVKKLQFDESGSPICPVCNESLAESEWASHVEMEKAKLVGIIQLIKSTKSPDNMCSTDQPRRKREQELSRIRNNHMKRLALKRGVAGLRDSLTPFSRQSNDESGSSGSPEVKKEDDSFGAIKCSICLRSTEYGIVSSSFDNPRCQDCFDQIKNSTLITQTPMSSLLEMTAGIRTPSPSGSHSPPEKKPRVE